MEKKEEEGRFEKTMIKAIWAFVIFKGLALTLYGVLLVRSMLK